MARPTRAPYVKDAFDEYVVHGRTEAVSPEARGTKAAAHYVLQIAAGAEITVPMRLFAEEEAPPQPFGPDFDRVFAQRIAEADEFYRGSHPGRPSRKTTAASAARRTPGCSGRSSSTITWSRTGSTAIRTAAAARESRKQGRNHDWRHLFNRDVISVPDKWEYPWYAAWDLAFQMIPLAQVDPQFGQGAARFSSCANGTCIPAARSRPTNSAFDDVNPPVHAWACWRVYKMTGPPRPARSAVSGPGVPQAADQLHLVGQPQGRAGQAPLRRRLPRARQHRRLRPLEAVARRGSLGAGRRHGVDGLLLRHDAGHRPGIGQRGSGLRRRRVEVFRAFRGHRRRHELRWAERGFGTTATASTTISSRSTAEPLAWPIRSMVGLIPLVAVEVFEDEVLARLPGFRKRMQWFIENRRDLAAQVYMHGEATGKAAGCWRSPPRAARTGAPLHAGRERVSLALRRPLAVAGPQGSPVRLFGDGGEQRVDYEPGESPLAALRRQLQLARAGLVSRELPADRGPGAVPPFLRRHVAGRMSDRLGPADESERGGPRAGGAGWRVSSAATPAAGGPATARTGDSPTTPIGATWCSSTSISTATPARGSGRAIRPAGPRW